MTDTIKISRELLRQYCERVERGAMDFDADERMQLAQLIGYSVSGYGDLSYASRESVERADEIADALAAHDKQSGEVKP
jgi:hypothetical protein